MRSQLGYLPALDGLRALSIALVVGYHAFGIPMGGTVGVDVFFVLSGFLITSLLIGERESTGRVNLRAFYARRCRRLLPALVFMLAIYLIATAAAGENRVLAAVVGGSYVANFFDASGNPLLTNAHLNQLWSLAQEEQFYVLWPTTLLLLSRNRSMFRILLGLIAVLIVYRAALTFAGAAPNRLYYAPDLRADGLLIGAAIAVAHARRQLSVPEWTGKIGLAGLAVGAIIGWGFRSWPAWGQPLFLVSVGLLLLAALADTDLARGFSSRPLVGLGRRSYSLYLWHSPVIGAAAYVAGESLETKVGAVLAATGIATISYRVVEQPFRRRQSGPSASRAPASVAT